MTPQELNEAVARKLGVIPKVIDCGAPHCEHSTPVIRDYCHSIAAAWEIVEKLKETELVALCFHDGAWHCEINLVREAPEDERVDEEADTAPMAIVKAFLKLP